MTTPPTPHESLLVEIEPRRFTRVVEGTGNSSKSRDRRSFCNYSEMNVYGFILIFQFVDQLSIIRSKWYRKAWNATALSGSMYHRRRVFGFECVAWFSRVLYDSEIDLHAYDNDNDNLAYTFQDKKN